MTPTVDRVSGVYPRSHEMPAKTGAMTATSPTAPGTDVPRRGRLHRERIRWRELPPGSVDFLVSRPRRSVQPSGTSPLRMVGQSAVSAAARRHIRALARLVVQAHPAVPRSPACRGSTALRSKHHDQARHRALPRRPLASRIQSDYPQAPLGRCQRTAISSQLGSRRPGGSTRLITLRLSLTHDLRMH